MDQEKSWQAYDEVLSKFKNLYSTEYYELAHNMVDNHAAYDTSYIKEIYIKTNILYGYSWHMISMLPQIHKDSKVLAEKSRAIYILRDRLREGNELYEIKNELYSIIQKKENNSNVSGAQMSEEEWITSTEIATALCDNYIASGLLK